MTIQFSCPRCGKQLAAPESLAGQDRTCPHCRTSVRVPASSAANQADAKLAAEAAPASDHQLLLFPMRDDEYGNLIDMTAMVDIVFFLLIFFLVTSMQSLEAVVNLPTPEASESASSNLQAVPSITDDAGQIVVTIDADDAVWVDDEEALSEQDLRSKLRAARNEDERENMLIKGAGDATHGKFVMVMDAAADAGMKEIKFSVDENEDTADAG